QEPIQEPIQEFEIPDTAQSSSIEEGTYYSLQNSQTGLCIGVKNGSTRNGIVLIDMACDDIAHQSIQLWEEKTGLYSMTFEHSGKMARYDRRNKSFKQARS
ncbi:MAG TPA: hypothetical protein DDW29_07170, partial [Gammaproteobacteria bacterium]|nr:hypothetical protein [Gammaproteobacteria bacterium]